MSRRAATILQADVARAIRAAKQAGAAEVEVRVGRDAAILIRFTPSTAPEQATEPKREIVL